ncbi:MAG TPA: hypothetical protein VI455_08435 [Terriglobia bacterium]
MKEVERPSVRGLKLGLSGVFLSALLLTTAFAQNPSQSAAAKPAASQAPAANQPPAGEPRDSAAAKTLPEKVVMRVGSQQVTAGQIEGLVKTLPAAYQRTTAQQGFKVLGDQYAVLLVLSHEAVAQGLDQTPEFKMRLELQRLQWLALDEQKKMAGAAQATPEEVKQYYDTQQKDFEEILVRQVNIRKKVASPRGDSPGLPEEEAKKLAENIRQALASGQDAAKVAEQYKMANVVLFDPNPRPFRRGSLAGDMDKTAWTLKDGECSEIQNNQNNLYFIQVVKHDQRSLQDVSKEIEGKIQEEKFNKSLDSLKQQANIWLDPEFFAPPAGAKPDADAEAPGAKQSSPQSQGPKAPPPSTAQSGGAPKPQ